MNLKLEVRMSFKIQLTELSSLHIFLKTDWQHCTSNRVHSKLVLSYFDIPINNFKKYCDMQYVIYLVWISCNSTRVVLHTWVSNMNETV